MFGVSVKSYSVQRATCNVQRATASGAGRDTAYAAFATPLPCHQTCQIDTVLTDTARHYCRMQDQSCRIVPLPFYQMSSGIPAALSHTLAHNRAGLRTQSEQTLT